jgi:maltooligosyltrehalose trehalohydrolase
MKFDLWAPAAKSVDLVTDTRRIAMLPAGEPGHWQAEVDPGELRQGYRYSLDGNAPIPDPRSPWQPQGVHGASHRVDAAELRDLRRESPVFLAKPLREAVIYELHVGTFTPQGTYAAARERLPHLVQLGITHVELMPVATSPGRRGWGYDGVDLFAPLPAYGTPRQLAEFVRACHASGIAVLLDVVYNHLGPDGNYLAQYGPYFTDQYKTAWGEALNYDGSGSDSVRRFLIDNALMWLRDYGFDGLRLDAVHAIFCFGAVHVLEELGRAVDALGAELGRNLVLIAESDLNDPRLVRPVSQGGYGLSAHWSDDFHHAVHRLFTGETDGYYADFQGLPDVAIALRDGYVYQGRYSAHRGRRHGRPPAGVLPDQLVVCSQNHDQIGNRAQGERLSMLLDVPQLKAIAAMTLLSPFVPLLFQGEEWGARTPFLYFTDHENAELGRLVAEGRSREFGSFRWAGSVPNPQEIDTFERSKLDWSELRAPLHAELLDWYRQLIRLRRDAGDAAANQKPRVEFDAQAGWLSFNHRGLLAIFNLSPRPQFVPRPAGRWESVLRSAVAMDAGLVPAHGTEVYAARDR